MIAFWFLHAWLALAAAPIAAAAITVHLLNRARQVPLRWAAMQFLKAAVSQSRRRLSLERWLLIALRTIMLTLLALFIARPIVRGMGLAGAADIETALLLVVDNGLAMQAPSAQAGQSLQADGVDAALPLLRTWKGPVAILPAVGEAKAQWFDRADMAEAALGKVVSTAGRADWPGLLARAKDVLRECGLPSHRRTVLIVTSLTQGNWPRVDLLRQPLLQIKDFAGRVLLLDLQPASRDNITLADLAVESAFAGRDLPVRAGAAVANRSSVSISNVRIIWSVDGREVHEDSLPEVPVAAQRIVTADLPALAAGDHNVSARLADDIRLGTGAGDSAAASGSSTQSVNVLAADDQRWTSVTVPQRRRIVLVEPDMAAAPGNRASLFVAAVLSSAAQQCAIPLQVDTITPSTLQTALIEPADAILLCDVANLAPADWQLLKRQLGRGTGLVSWVGPRWSNGAVVRSASAVDVLAGLPGVTQIAPPRSDWSVRLATPVRTAFLDLADSTSGGGEPLGRIQTLARVDVASGAQVLAQTASGLPVVLLRQVGQGRSILVTTAPDLSWSSLPGQPMFPAFVLGLLREAATRVVDGTQVDAGQTIRLAVPAGGAAQQAHWIKPDGSSEPARISLDAGLTMAVLPVAGLPGAYQLEAGGPSRTAFANADAHAGDLREMTDTSRQDLAEAGVRSLARKELSSSLVAVSSDEWTQPLGYLVMALALLEVILTAAFTRTRQ